MTSHTPVLDRPVSSRAAVSSFQSPRSGSLFRHGTRPGAGHIEVEAFFTEPEGRAVFADQQPSPAIDSREASDGAAALDKHAGSWTIERVIEERAVRTLFQPIVHLETKSIVGFEALTRGPEGSDLESPLALLEAAAACGRLGELDWLCRVMALQAAAASGLPSSLAWFINVEPASLHTLCPEYLLREFTRASANLRVIFEFVERDLDANVTAVLNAADDVRNNSWGVALDDVGAMDSSLALMPLVQPDVVKLDRGLLTQPGGTTTIPVIAAVLAYAERCNASILAEGIETQDEEVLARSFGAEFGQGYLYGRPGPLPESLPALREVVPIRQLVASVDDMTPFEALSARLTARNASESEISYIGDWLEQASFAGYSGAATSNFHDTKWATADDRHTLKQVIGSNTLTLITAGDPPDHVGPMLRAGERSTANPLAREWVVIVLKPHFAAVFAARSKGGWSGEGNPKFDYVLTHDRDLTVTAARALLQRTDTGVVRWLERLGEPPERPSESVSAQTKAGRPAEAVPRYGRSRMLRFRRR